MMPSGRHHPGHGRKKEKEKKKPDAENSFLPEHPLSTSHPTRGPKEGLGADRQALYTCIESYIHTYGVGTNSMGKFKVSTTNATPRFPMHVPCSSIHAFSHVIRTPPLLPRKFDAGSHLAMFTFFYSFLLSRPPLSSQSLLFHSTLHVCGLFVSHLQGRPAHDMINHRAASPQPPKAPPHLVI
ncbi:hypothetical protein LX32DRAFT_439611 [Colletotrichum zoysiae]|uniref:Uncharacterized protein n=1 Tax=Colletotrichum zoysiae TaxID=1216348 RepID=A0AAD9LYQ0_9PEZI|nr:hypothetical protein LX32DRAFT_439611 [Colletotrichum zoysiae]